MICFLCAILRSIIPVNWRGEGGGGITGKYLKKSSGEGSGV